MSDEPTPEQPLFILHVEDDPKDADLIENTLIGGGLRVDITRVDDRESFLAGLDRRPLDLILCDYQVPKFHGLAALELARERRPDVPFIFVSGDWRPPRYSRAARTTYF